MSDLFKISSIPELKSPSLLVSWNEDGGQAGVASYISRKLPYHAFAEIEPAEFFPLAGVAVEDNLVQFPESRFYFCPGNELLVFQSEAPSYDWFHFLDLILQIAREQCHIRELYVLGNMVSLAAHTSPRQLMAVFNSLELKAELGQYNFASELDYRTPSGQRPTLNSFLLWAARRRDIAAATVWIPTPFYLLTAGDPKSLKKAVDFFNQRFNLQLDMADLDTEITRQSGQLTLLRNRSPEISLLISRLESNLSLSAEESERLAKEVGEFLKSEG